MPGIRLPRKLGHRGGMGFGRCLDDTHAVSDRIIPYTMVIYCI